jgi:hypothetical protein
MPINRRRAASSKISSEKKLGGHRNEDEFASLISGMVIKGTQKGDVEDKKGFLYSVKSGKKWQVFLYGFERINSSKHLQILQPCLEAFPKDSNTYFKDRISVIEFKEKYVKRYGREKAKKLSNDEVIDILGKNEYINSKNKLAKATDEVYNLLKNKSFLQDFLDEALFNNKEVSYLAIKDTTYRKDDAFKVFTRKDVLEILSLELFPATSKAGNVPEDFNVPGQKTLLCYKTKAGTQKNIVEIEIRNDSDIHYRQVRFNMYSRDALTLLLDKLEKNSKQVPGKKLSYFGESIRKI